MLEDAAYSGFLGGGTGGLLPQLRHGERFYEKIPGAITITGSPPDTPGNPFRNPDGTLPLKEQFHESGDPDLKAKEAPATDRQQHVRSFRADLISGKHDMEELGRRAQGDPELEGYLKNHEDQLKQAEETAYEKARSTRIVNTDEVRPFLPGYAEADPLTRDNDYHQAASAMNDRVLARMLAETPEKGVVTVLAGGGGSGKSTASEAFVPESDFTFDTTLSSSYWAEKLQEQIHGSGRSMDVIYVHRRFPLAVDNMVRRYLKDVKEGRVGRIVPLPVAISAHIGAQETILGLKGSNIKIVDNNGDYGDFHQITLEDLAKERYLNTHEQDTRGTGSGGTTARRGGDPEPERGSGPRQTDNGQDHRRLAEKTLGEEGRRLIEDYRAEGVLTDAEADAFLGIDGTISKPVSDQVSDSQTLTAIDPGGKTGEDLHSADIESDKPKQQDEEGEMVPENGGKQKTAGRTEEEIRERIREALARRKEGNGGEKIGDGSESDVFEFGPDQVLKEIKAEGVSRYGNDGRIHEEYGQEAVEEKAKVIKALGGMQTIVLEEGGKIFIVQDRGTPITETEYLSIELPFGIEPTRQGSHEVEIDGDVYLISDLKPENFVKDSQGNIRLIDLITGKKGKGGGSR